jgi:dihydroorotate dehydrogenase (fumarate)
VWDAELALRLRGNPALPGRVKASLAVTGGIRTALDVVNATMAGAHATQLEPALFRHGPRHLGGVRQGLEAWMTENEWDSLDAMRANMSYDRIPDPTARERAHYRRMLNRRAPD